MKNLTGPVEAFAGALGMEVETPQIKDCTPEPTCISGAVSSGYLL